MATTLQFPLDSVPAFNYHAIDPMESELVDWNQTATPVTSSVSSHNPFSTISTPSTTMLPGDDDLQGPVKPSHEYERFKQQTGLPLGSVAGLSPSHSPDVGMYSNTGLNEAAMLDAYPAFTYWNNGLGENVDTHLNSDYFFSPADMSQPNFIDPSALTQPEPAPVRVYPGHHQQQAQAAAAKAEQERRLLEQQRQQQHQRQQHQQRQQRQHQQAHQQQQYQQRQRQQDTLSSPTTHRPAHSSQPTQQQNRTQPQRRNVVSRSPEEQRAQDTTIARVLNQIRQKGQDSAPASQNDQDQSHPLLRARKDEDEMDEDEKLLASEAGKLLNSKERRQLRNKVSARNFRSRRKDYIQELEKGLHAKTAEAHQLAAQNRQLAAENQSFQHLIEKLLGHQSFAPFLDDLSRDVEGIQMQAAMTPAPTLADATSQLKITNFSNMTSFNSQPSESSQMGAAAMPDIKMDPQTLNPNANNAGWGSMNAQNFQQNTLFTVAELPEGSTKSHGMESGKDRKPVSFNADEDFSRYNMF